MKRFLVLILTSMLLLSVAYAEQESRTLVVYYSASGTTQAIAEQKTSIGGTAKAGWLKNTRQENCRWSWSRLM